MIEEKNGRLRSHRTQEELIHEIQLDMENLTSDERAALDLMLDELKHPEKIGGPKMIDAIMSAEYNEIPVSMKTFLTDPYYMGEPAKDLYEPLRNDLIEIFDCGRGYSEIIFTGAIGVGKTYASAFGIIRVIYELSCLRNPQRSSGIANKTGISIVCLSVNENQAIKVVLENIGMKLEQSPYFKAKFPFEILKKEIRFPNDIEVTAHATTDTSVLGKNIISAFIDEINFIGKNRKVDMQLIDRAEALYNQIKRRIRSRFEKRPGPVFLCSSKQTLDDFINKRVANAISTKDPKVFVRDYAKWLLAPDLYCGERFYILVGNENIYSKILEDEEVEQYKANLPSGTLLIDVPIELKPEFIRDLEGSLRDTAGISTVTITPYIQQRGKILDAVDSDREHPFTVETLDPSKKDGKFRWDLMVRPASATNPNTIPIMHPAAARHLHIDIGITNDCAGICMSHIGSWDEVDRCTQDGQVYSQTVPIYHVDFMLQVKPPAGGEIIIEDLGNFVYDLIKKGYMLTAISMDSPYARQMIQTFKKQGLNAYAQSVDKTMDPYNALKTALYENRVRYYHYLPLIKELRKLQVNWKIQKVDHPAGGSKDVADALAGVIFTLAEEGEKHPSLPLVSEVELHSDHIRKSLERIRRQNQQEDVIDENPPPPTPSELYTILPPFIIG